MNIAVKRNRTRYKIKSVSSLVRVSVHKTNQFFSAQAIDAHAKGVVVASVHQKAFEKENKSKDVKPVELAEKMGEALAKELLAKGVTAVAYDRSGYIYHGKVKAFAEGMRKAGLKL